MIRRKGHSKRPAKPQPTVKPARRRGAQRAGFSLQNWLKHYFRLHAQVFVSSLGRLMKSPAASLMTAAVIGIALALPSGMLTLLDNLQRLSAGWDGGASISLFLNADISDENAVKIAQQLQSREELASVKVLSRAQALEDFRAHSGFGAALDNLDENPLPAVLVIQPTPQHSEALAVQQLVQRLSDMPSTDLAQLDLQWVKRFNALMEIGRRGIWVVGSLLGLAVLLIVGNTIRLDIQSRREEIEITKLIGGTDAFIRRPFLHTGIWYGLLGTVIATLLVHIAFFLLSGPVSQLAGLYQSSFLLQSLGFVNMLSLIAIGCLLGWAGSWLAVGRHLRAIEPT